MPLASETPLPCFTRDIVAAIADRPRDPDSVRQARAAEAYQRIESFAPRDGVEAMLAGHVVLFEELLLEAIHDARRAATPDLAHRTRQQVGAMAKLQLAYLRELTRRRPARPKSAAESPAEPVPAPRPDVPQPVATTPTSRHDPVAAPARPVPIAAPARAPALTGVTQPPLSAAPDVTPGITPHTAAIASQRMVLMSGTAAARGTYDLKPSAASARRLRPETLGAASAALTT